MSAIGGTLRLGELVSGGVIRHAIKCNLFAAKYSAYNDDATRGFRWPARNADGYAAAGTYRGKVPAVEMGALLALKPDFNLAGLRTEPARILARAFTDYGAYLVDDTAYDVYGIETEWSPQGRLRYHLEKGASPRGHLVNPLLGHGQSTIATENS